MVRLVSWILAMALMLEAASPWAQPAAAVDPEAATLQRCFELQRSDPDTSITLAEGLLTSTALAPVTRLRALLCLGGAKSTVGDPVAANGIVNRALHLIDADGLPMTERIRGYAGVSGVLLAIGQGHRAIGILEQAYQLVQGSDDAAARLAVLDLLGNIRASEFDDHVGAEPYFVEAIAVAAALGNEEPFRDYNHALNLVELGRLDEAERAFDAAAAKAQKSGKWELISHRIRTNRSDILVARKEYRRARAELLESIAAQQRLRDVQGEAVSRTNLGAVQLAVGENEGALESAREAIRLAGHGKFLREQLGALRLLVAAHSALGEPGPALAASQTLHAMEVKRLREQNLRSMAGLQAQVQDEGTARENERLQYQSERAGLLRDLALALLLVVVLSGAGLAWFQRRVQRRLRRLGAVDPLTGLLNRREAARQLAAISAGTDRSALLLIDVDHFKSVNDQYGHAAGDRVLADLATRLKGACRPGDIVARWGGEEFLVACPGLSCEQTMRFAERLCRSIADTPVGLRNDGMLTTTVSIGFAPFAFFPGRADGGWQDAVRLADRALYAAKHSGRNAWAGMWGIGRPTGVALACIEDDPRRAADAGWIELLGSRAMDWVAADPAVDGKRADCGRAASGLVPVSG